MSDFLDLPGFLGFLPAARARGAALLYFHENQLTWPWAEGVSSERDLHFAFTHVLSCARADAVAFNSSFHREAFREGVAALWSTLPRTPLRAAVEQRLEAATVLPPGPRLDEIPLGTGAPEGGPLRVVFPHRWEEDKEPATFLDAVEAAIGRGARLELVLLGEWYSRLPDGVPEKLERLAGHVLHRGHLARRGDYLEAIGSADLVVSTARHEFFGVAVAEAMAAGATPLVPRRLAYPELVPGEEHAACLYDSFEELVQRLVAGAAAPDAARREERRRRFREAIRPHEAARTVRRLDDLLEELAERPRPPGGN